MCIMLRRQQRFFFFNDTATTEIYTLSLHDALPISYTETGGETARGLHAIRVLEDKKDFTLSSLIAAGYDSYRSEEHTSELQSQSNLVCRLLLEKKKIRLHAFFYTYHCFEINTLMTF